MGKTDRAKTEPFETPARLVAALSKWVGSQDERVSEGAESEGYRRPARLTAALTQWIAARDDRTLRRAFRRVGFEVVDRQPDHHYVHKFYGHSAYKLRSGLQDDEFRAMAEEAREQRRTYLYFNRLYTLYQGVRNVARAFPSGELGFLEVGVYRGGSAFFLARAAERYLINRARLVAVDTFEGHAAEDLPAGREGAHTPGAFSSTSFEDVRGYLSPFPFVEVVEGRIQDVAPALEGDLHLVHVDVDIYGPTRFALDLVAQRLVPGGIAIVDDYGFTTCPGARRAVDEWIERRAEGFVVYALDSGQALLIRTA
jgi:O-methyltransferase